jgi:hypothetical protein
MIATGYDPTTGYEFVVRIQNGALVYSVLNREYQSDVIRQMSSILINCYGQSKKATPSDVREEGEICLLWAICQDPTA